MESRMECLSIWKLFCWNIFFKRLMGAILIKMTYRLSTITYIELDTHFSQWILLMMTSSPFIHITHSSSCFKYVLPAPSLMTFMLIFVIKLYKFYFCLFQEKYWRQSKLFVSIFILSFFPHSFHSCFECVWSEWRQMNINNTMIWIYNNIQSWNIWIC